MARKLIRKIKIKSQRYATLHLRLLTKLAINSGYVNYHNNLLHFLSKNSKEQGRAEWSRVVLVPIPSDPIQNLKRGFVLPKILAQILNRELFKGQGRVVELFKKTRGIEQKSKSALERRILPKNYFKIDWHKAKKIIPVRDLIWVIVDDIATTGSTLHFAQFVLKKHFPTANKIIKIAFFGHRKLIER